MKVPTESMICLALVKRGSQLSRSWKLEKPGYCIYEYEKAFGTHEIRWGDGSWEKIDKKQFADLILLPQFGEKEISALFDT